MSRATAQRRALSLRLARLLRRALLPAALIGGVLLWRSYGTLRVPAGMDTMPQYPPGTLCVIDKQPGDLRVGQVVFVDLRGGTVLSRIVAVQGGTILVQHDAADSVLPDSDEVGPLPHAAVRALVLSGFAPDVVDDTTTEGGR